MIKDAIEIALIQAFKMGRDDALAGRPMTDAEIDTLAEHVAIELAMGQTNVDGLRALARNNLARPPAD